MPTIARTIDSRSQLRNVLSFAIIRADRFGRYRNDLELLMHCYRIKQTAGIGKHLFALPLDGMALETQHATNHEAIQSLYGKSPSSTKGHLKVPFRDRRR
jgi:hypothetical protein